MTIYFEGNGKPSPVSMGQARDQFIRAIVAKRDEVLDNPVLESYDDATQRDRAVANAMVHGVLSVLDGDSAEFPQMNLIPYAGDDDIQEAKEAGANYFDPESGDIGGGLAEYWNLISS